MKRHEKAVIKFMCLVAALVFIATISAISGNWGMFAGLALLTVLTALWAICISIVMFTSVYAERDKQD